eukprot:GHVL01009839.1.p1 GENE.GHVL01009839.1~~GHVL01009839.1.p1  ORF type:complete len:308 (-),score=68.20 GHVL01009839.1:130-1053(-)
MSEGRQNRTNMMHSRHWRSAHAHFLDEQQKRRQLQNKIETMSNQLVIGGNNSNVLGGISDDVIGEDEVLPDNKYTKLLLRQRDVMLALTGRLTEREDEVNVVTNRLSRFEEVCEQQSMCLLSLLRFILESNLSLPSEIQDILYPLLSKLPSTYSDKSKKSFQTSKPQDDYIDPNDSGIWGLHESFDPQEPPNSEISYTTAGEASIFETVERSLSTPNQGLNGSERRDGRGMGKSGGRMEHSVEVIRNNLTKDSLWENNRGGIRGSRGSLRDGTKLVREGSSGDAMGFSSSRGSLRERGGREEVVEHR